MVFSFFDPITGGRVGEIVAQESKSNRGRTSLPMSKGDEDKLEKFCETYKDFIDVSAAYETFSSYWEIEKTVAGDTLLEERRYPLILRALYKSFPGDFWKAFFAKMSWSILVIFSIWFFVFEILTFIRARADDEVTDHMQNYEVLLCVLFFVDMLLLSVGIQQMGIYSSILGSKVKAALTTAVYKKMIIRDAYQSKADVVSLISKDVAKIAEACLSLQFLWSGIFETLAVIVVLSSLIGADVIPALGVMAVFLPLQYWMGMVVAYRKVELSAVSKTRISMMEEIMRAIKLIKIYGWESSFFENLNAIRSEEKSLLYGINTVQSTILGLIFCLPPIVSLVVFGTQEATGKIDSVVVFTTLSFFNTLRVPFSKLPKSLRDVLDAFSCFDRIQDFLLEPELHPELSKKPTDKHLDEDESRLGIVFRNASFSYGQGAKIVLSNINLSIPPGSLVMVAGPVAGGKSNLLKSILGDLTVREGTNTESHSRAYVPQVPWTALGTVRDNILFGQPYDEAFYKKVIHACALEPDLKMMPEGDQTWIGERGGNLSGGQKQRIALARAAYSGANLYVLDSPLSAVDMYSCQHIFKYCIQEIMIGGGGTVVLATHQTELFFLSDHLVVMEGGKQVFNDKYSFSAVKHLFPTLADDEAVSDHQLSEQQGLLVTSQRPKESKRLRPDASMPVLALPAKTPPLTQGPSKETSKTISTPETARAPTTNSTKNIYMWYFKIIGLFMFMTATAVFVVGQTVRVYGDVWISVWTNRQFEDEGFTSDAFYASIYCMLVFVFLCLSFLRAFYWFYLGRNAGNKLHDMAFGAALKAPMHFFHVTPIGNLLSFFSKDVDTIDDVLVDNMLMYQILLWIVVLAVGLVAYNLPVFLAICAGLGVVYVYYVRVFIATSVPIKQAAGKSQSEVVAHTAETLSGLAVVRAFRQQDNFLSENLKFQVRSSAVSFSLANLALWLAFRVDLIGSLLVLACCLLAVFDTNMDSSTAGLIVSNSFQILLFFSIMSRFMGEVHDNMTAVEKARKMAELEEEVEPDEPADVPESWPSKGEITFDDVVMSYLPGKPPVLKGITFSILPGEKIGVVGRTGAGKCESRIECFLRICIVRMSDPEFYLVFAWSSLSDCGTVPFSGAFRRED
jgi:ATP-binding cassette subfamily C (CFTR/MRP) protein 1